MIHSGGFSRGNQNKSVVETYLDLAAKKEAKFDFNICHFYTCGVLLDESID